MMISFHNLPDSVYRSAAEDVDVVRRLASLKGIRVPGLRLSIVSLENDSVPADLPKHHVQQPAAEPPVVFRDRCDWETLRQSFQLLRRGDVLWVVAGGAEGALYGVDEALERLTGVIWAGLRDEDLLFGPVRALPTGVQSPSFPYRLSYGGDDHDYVRWMSRNRYNGCVRSSAAWATRLAKQNREVVRQYQRRAMHIIVGEHGMEGFLPEEEFARHADWFGMRDGRRVRQAPVILPDCPHLDATLPIQPCYSNPEVAEFITDRMAALAKEYPDIEILGLWPHDGVNNWCQCPKCLKRVPYEHMYDLALRLARKTPSRLAIELIAYSNLLTTPRGRLPKSDRIISMFCPYLRHYAHRTYDRGGPSLITSTLYPKPDRINPVDEREYGKLFRKWQPIWKQSGSTLGIFEYGGNLWPDETGRTDRQRFLYHPSNAIRFDEARWYRQRGVRYFCMCAHYSAWPDAVQTLGAARALWNCDESSGSFESRYYAALAGPKGRCLRSALRRVSDCLSGGHSPLKALARLGAVAKSVRAPQARQYSLWGRYLSLAWASREAEENGCIQEAIEREREVERFLKGILPKMGNVVSARSLLGYATSRQERLASKISKKNVTDYRL